VTEKNIIATTALGSWYLFSLELLPDPPEEANSREMAHVGAINGSVFNPETLFLITAGADGLLRSWQLSEIPTANSPPPKAGAFITGSHSTMSEMGVVDMREWGEITFICWAQKADRWVTAHSDGHLRVWTTDVFNCECVLSVSCSICRVTALTVDDPDVILVALDDRTIRCFALTSGRQLRTLAGHQGAVCAVAAGRDLDFYVSASWDRTMKVWGKVHLTDRASSQVSRPSVISSKRLRDPGPPRRERVQATRPSEQRPPQLYRPVSQYEKKKHEIERRRRREKGEHDAKMRSPAAKEIKAIQKLIWEML
jgi:hypothetical protein